MNKPTVYIQDADGNERTLPVTSPDPDDGTYCAHMDDEGQAWIRIVLEMSTVTQIVHNWDYEEGGEPNWDDMHEWDREDFSNAYQVGPEGAALLDYIVREETDSRYNAYGLKDEMAPFVLENIQEGLHQSLDGWTEEQKIVIRAYLADLAYSAYLTKEHRVEAQIYTYVVFKSDYMGEEPKMYEWRGTWRGVLEHLHGTLDKNVHEWARGKTDKYLEDMFNDMNGDGMAYYMVYNVESSEQVIN